MKRRQFIQACGFLSGALFAGNSPAAIPFTPPLADALHSAVDDVAFWRIVREQFVFPADYVYLNTGGIGAVPGLVLRAVTASTEAQQLEPSPGHDLDKWLAVKEKCAICLGPGCLKEEVALVSTATEGINIILNGLPLQKGDEIITSTHEHAALHVALLNLMQRRGVVIRTFEPDLQNDAANVERIDRLINARTRLIFISHVTCTTGQIFPVKAIGALARDRRIWFALDGAQSAGAVPLDLVTENIDFYACSGHKWLLGPKRTGILYVRQDLLDTLRPAFAGAHSDGGFDISKRELKLHPSAQRYEYATQNDALFHGLGKAIDFLSTIGLKAIFAHNRQLAEQLCQGLAVLANVKILSPRQSECRSSIITFKMENHKYNEIASHLQEQHIRVRTVSEAGLEAIRISLHLYNNSDEVARLLAEIEKLAI